MSTRSTIKFLVDETTDCSIHAYEELLSSNIETKYRIEVDGVYESFNLAIPKKLADLLAFGPHNTGSNKPFESFEKAIGEYLYVAFWETIQHSPDDTDWEFKSMAEHYKTVITNMAREHFGPQTINKEQ